MIIGLGISISSTGSQSGSSSGGPVVTNGLLTEAGDFLLMEDGSNILLD